MTSEPHPVDCICVYCEDLRNEVVDLRAELQAARDLLKKSLRLSHYTLMSEESSSSHHHGPKRAAVYAEKAAVLEREIFDFIKEKRDAE